MVILSTSSSEISSPRLSYSPVLRADSCAAICCATSSFPPLFKRTLCILNVIPSQDFSIRRSGMSQSSAGVTKVPSEIDGEIKVATIAAIYTTAESFALPVSANCLFQHGVHSLLAVRYFASRTLLLLLEHDS